MATIEEFRLLQFKVGRVVEAKPHPNADRLLVVTVDVGGVQKEVVAGIARHYAPADLINKLVVVVDNLDPMNLRGVQSNGMLLAAQDGETLALVSPERPVAPGSVVK